jgi:hypothetical protein
MIFLLQWILGLNRFPDSQKPFQLDGIGPSPSSLKAFDSGHIPASSDYFFRIHFMHKQEQRGAGERMNLYQRPL